MGDKVFKKFSNNFSESQWDYYSSMSGKQKKVFKEYLNLGEMLDESISKIDMNDNNFGITAINHYESSARFKGFKKPYGAKARSLFKNKYWLLNLDKDYLIFKSPTLFKKGVNIVWGVLKEFKTPRGLHYIFYNEGGRFQKVYSSHFLDRYIERRGKQRNREQSIIDLYRSLDDDHYYYRIANSLNFDFDFSDIQKNKNLSYHNISCELYLQDGMGIGRTYLTKESKVRDYIQTYVSLDMMRRDQLERHAKAYVQGLQNNSREVLSI